MVLETVSSLPKGAIPVDEEQDIPVVDSLPKGAIPVDAPSMDPNDPDSPNFEHDFSASNMLWNVPGSVAGVVSDTYNMVTDPIGTGKALYNMGFSGLKDAILDRYGSWEKFQKTLEEDPAGVGLDLSFVVAPAAGGARTAASAAGRAAGRAGSAAGVKAAGLAEKAAGYAQKGGQMLQSADPVNVVAKGAVAAGKGVRGALDETLGMSTNAGSETLRLAREAGRKGGVAQEAFERGQRSQNFFDRRPDEPNPVAEATMAKDAMAAENYAQYKQDMGKHFAKTDPIDPGLVMTRLKVRELMRRKEAPTATGRGAMPAAVEKAWRKDIQPLYDRFVKEGNYTLSGIDTLRADLDNLIRNKYIDDKQVSGLLGAQTKSLRNMAENISPGYKRDTAAYAKNAEVIAELERALSLNSKASTDTALRKMQQAIKNYTSHGNFGYRDSLMKMLDEKAPGLKYELAGQALSPGLRSAFFTQTAGATGFGAYYLGNPLILGTLLAFSPRIIGKAQKGLGYAQRPFAKAFDAFHKTVMNSGVGPQGPVMPSPGMANVGRGISKLRNNASTIRRGVQEAGTIVGTAKEDMENNEPFYNETQQQQMKSYLKQQNKAKNIGLSPAVIDRVVGQMSSSNPREVERGFKTIANNKRVRELMDSEPENTSLQPIDVVQ